MHTMERNYYSATHERPYTNSSTSHLPPPPLSSAQQPSAQMPYPDPFHTTRDPFLGGSQSRRDGGNPGVRAWTPSHSTGSNDPHPPPPSTIANANNVSVAHSRHPLFPSPPPPSLHHQQHHQPPPPHPHHQPAPPHHHPQPNSAPPPPNGLGMPPPYETFDSARRRSLGGAISPPNYAGSDAHGRHPDQRPGSHNAPPPPSSFSQRQMPPPSPTQNPVSSASHLSTAPRGPPTSSPFSGLRDFSSSRPTGMSIGALLGRDEERKPAASPHASSAFPAPVSKPMHPPSPGRARSTSMRDMRDSAFRPGRELTPPRSLFHERNSSSVEPRRDGIFHSPPRHNEGSLRAFRAYAPEPAQPHPHAHPANGHAPPIRPTSQPMENVAPRHMEEMHRREENVDSRMGIFRYEQKPPVRDDGPYRLERPPQNGVTSHPAERSVFGPMDRDPHGQGPPRPQPGAFGALAREEHVAHFRPAYQAPPTHPADGARESIEGRGLDSRHPLARPSPPPEVGRYDPTRAGMIERPPTFEEHQRMEAAMREQQFLQRKEGESSVHRAILNLSPELDRKGRSSPLPQAVQGAQPRFVGPGGDNPGIKTEFGRMFAGLGSGVGSATPVGGHSANGFSTPSRMSPAARQPDSGDFGRDNDGGRGGAKTLGKGGKKNGRRSRDEIERPDGDGRSTPDSRNLKRNKTAHHHHHHVHPHHHHHHHHHHHEAAEGSPGAYSMMRFPSNPLPHASSPSGQSHHHHHHHHAHPGLHHGSRNNSNAAVVPPMKKPTMTVINDQVLKQSDSQPRRHLGSQLYTTAVDLPNAAADLSIDAKLPYRSHVTPIPYFEGKENCTYTVRVPRYYLQSSSESTSGTREPPNRSFEEICRRREVWGTDIYTDDSDPVAAAVHAGWIQGDFGDVGADLRQLQLDEESDPAKESNAAESAAAADQSTDAGPITALAARPSRPVRIPPGHEAHITLLLHPPLASYAATLRHHLLSRAWPSTHDGLSFAIHRIDFVQEGPEARFTQRGAAARKARIAREERQRREAAADLLLFATGGANGGGTVRVGA